MQVAELARAHRPKVIVGGFSAYSRIIDWTKLRAIADEVGAFLMVDMAHVAGLVAAGLYPSPVGVADITTSTTHKTLRGPRSGLILAKPNPELHKKINSAVFPGLQGGPLMHVIAAKAVAFQEALEPDFKVYQQQVLENTRTMAEVIASRGYHLVSGGTDNHLVLVSLVDKPLTGKDAEAALGRANITVNKNKVPNDPRSPMVTSGIRIGGAAMTSRGLGVKEMQQIGHWVCDVMEHWDNEAKLNGIRQDVLSLCQQFPVYQQQRV